MVVLGGQRGAGGAEAGGSGAVLRCDGAQTLSHMSTKGEVLTPAKVSARPFDTDPTDHCETPFEAYR